MKLINYIDNSGNFDYNLYRKIQEDGNKRKIHKVWASEEIIRNLSCFLVCNIKYINFGLCHGTRRGKEQEWFSKYTKSNFIGTEISDTATNFPNTIQWDFHETKPEWVCNVDVIYSNSWDHAYDPGKCFRAWLSCLSPGGILLLEHSTYHDEDRASQLDPFGIALDELVLFLTEIAQGEFNIIAVLRKLTDDPKLNEIGLAVVAVQRRTVPVDLTSWR